jgi:hypothetical protein
MKTGMAILLVLLIGTLLVTGMVLAQGGDSTPPGAAVLSGGHYQLLSLAVPAEVVARGGDYTLLHSAASGQNGSGCCCTYLPCVLRQ